MPLERCVELSIVAMCGVMFPGNRFFFFFFN